MSFRGRHHDGVGQDKIVIYHNPLGTLTFDPQITTSKTTTIRWLTEAGETITSGTTHDFSYTPTVGPKKCIIEVRGGLGLVTGIDANTDAITEIRNLSKCSNLTVLARLHTNTGLVVELSSIPGAKILDMRSTANGMLIQIARNANYIYLYPTAAIPNIEGSLDQLPATTLEAFIYNQLLITPGSIAHILGARNIRVYNMGWNATQVDSVIDSIYQAVVADANHFTYATPVLQIGGSGGSINAAPSGVYQEATPPTTGLEKVYYLCDLEMSEQDRAGTPPGTSLIYPDHLKDLQAGGGGKGSYDGIAYIDGSAVVVDDAQGNVLKEGTANTENVKTIESALLGFASGGLLKIASGMRIEKKITIPHNGITLEGNVGGSTELILGNNVNDSIIDTNGKNYVTIRNLKMNGSKLGNSSGHGIYVSGGSWLVRIQNVDVLSCKQNGIQLGDGTNAIHSTSITNVASENNGGSGIGMAGVYDSFVNTAWLESNSIGIDINLAQTINIENAECFSPIGIRYDDLTSATIDKCFFGSVLSGARGVTVAESGNGWDVKILNSSFVFPQSTDSEAIRIAGQDNKIRDNFIFFPNPPLANSKGIYLVNAARSIVVENKIQNCATAIVGTGIMVGHKIELNTFIGNGKVTNLTSGFRNNIGYLTENTGSSKGTGSEQAIAHGLAAITGCKAWVKYLNGARYKTELIEFDATNIYPTVGSEVAFEWGIAWS